MSTDAEDHEQRRMEDYYHQGARLLADQLRALPMPITLTGRYWYGQAWNDAANHLGHLTDARTNGDEQ